MNLHTQSLQLLHCFLPNWLNVDAAETPVIRDLDQIWPPEALWYHFADILVVVQRILAVRRVAASLTVEGEVEEGLIKVETIVEMTVAVLWLAVLLVLIDQPIAIVARPPLLAG